MAVMAGRFIFLPVRAAAARVGGSVIKKAPPADGARRPFAASARREGRAA
jgi:hypothetical protein